MAIIKIDDLSRPELNVFHKLTEAQLRNRLELDKGMFIVESPKVIRVALDAGYQPISLLMEEKHITGDASDIVSRIGEDVPIYTGDRQLLECLTGYTLTRGVLCAMRRPQPSDLRQVVQNAHRIAVIDGVVDTTNIGAIFRSAAALGVDAVAITTNSCDPLNRRAVRVSMGTVFLVPWAWMDETTGYSLLKEMGFRTLTLALTDRSVSLDDPILKSEPRLAMVLGTEGDGLPHHIIKNADYVVTIPMANGVDSLNVAAASAVAFWELRSRSKPTLCNVIDFK